MTMTATRLRIHALGLAIITLGMGTGCNETTDNIRMSEKVQRARATGEISGRDHNEPKYPVDEIRSLEGLRPGEPQEYYTESFEDLRYAIEEMETEGDRIRYVLLRGDEQATVTLTRDTESMLITGIDIHRKPNG